jgi:hypothetical protein
MYPRIPWELVADPSGSAEHTLGSTDLYSPDDVHLLVENSNTMKKNTEALLRASRQVGLEVNAEKPCACSCIVNIMQDEIATCG